MFHWLHKLLHPRLYEEAESISAQLKAHLQANQKTVDDYRERFKAAPLGQWSHAADASGDMMNEIWEFNDDGSGAITTVGPFGTVSAQSLFEWKTVADFQIACRITKWDRFEDDKDGEADEDDEPEVWENVRYDFIEVPTDRGNLISMVEIYSDGSLRDGFWESWKPLRFDELWHSISFIIPD